MIKKYYLVEIRVQSDWAEQFKGWLIPHMEEMSGLPCFYSHQLSRVENPKDDQSEVCYQAKYFFNEDSDFQRYLQEFAEKMRGDLPGALRAQAEFRRALVEEKSL